MGKQIYDKPVHDLMRDMVEDIGLKKRDIIDRTQVLDWFSKKFPKIKGSTISAHLLRMSINVPSRIHYNPIPEEDDLFFQIDGNSYRLYEPQSDPEPIYEKLQKVKGKNLETAELSLTDEILKIANRYTKKWNDTQASYEKRISELEQENEKLRSELDHERPIWDEIIDETLKKRIVRFGLYPKKWTES